jgi:hypothetical protein
MFTARIHFDWTTSFLSDAFILRQVDALVKEIFCKDTTDGIVLVTPCIWSGRSAR